MAQPLPQLDLACYSGWRKAVAAAQFLPTAYRLIHGKKLHPRHTFHLMDRREVPVGISAGDVSYAIAEDDIREISRLVVSLEDRRFRSHPGVDILGILRALRSNIRAGRVVEGGSTITQQLVRNTLLRPDRSVTRKLLEALLALAVEWHYSKSEILALYAQFVYMGPGVRGFEAASRLIYRRPLRRLDLDSLFGLAGLLRRPSHDYPVNDNERFRERRSFIARLYGRQQCRDEQRVAAQRPNPIVASGLEKPRWTSAVRTVCSAAGIPAEDIKKVGLTVDRTMQSGFDRLLKRISQDPALDCIAVVVLSNARSEVLVESAWSHGRDCSFSPTFEGSLQPGSTFKPFAALAALEEGHTPDSMLLSAPFESSFVKNADGSPWRVRNYAFRYHGDVTLTEAMRLSDNSAFARLTEVVQLARLQSTYERFRLCGNRKATPSIALGAVDGGLALIRIAAAYSAIARNGVYLEPQFVRFVHYLDGTSWWPQFSANSVIVGEYSAVARLKLMLSAALPQMATIGLAGKTGTTRRGSLLAAYNDTVSVVVWLTHKKSRPEGSTKGLSAFQVIERAIAMHILGHPRDPFAI